MARGSSVRCVGESHDRRSPMMRLPTVPDARTRAQCVRNILRVWDEASHETRARGASWYHEAHELARSLDTDTRRASGVIAALSANKSWRENVKLAHAAYAQDHIGHVADAVRKARAIMSGADPASVLPMARKTGNFYACIASPDASDAVCVDRHAHDIALGLALGEANRGLSNVNRYAWIADCYREAARTAGVSPMAMQATTWIEWRKRLAGTQGRTHDATSNW